MMMMEESSTHSTQRAPKSIKRHRSKDVASFSTSSGTHFLQTSARGPVDPMWPCKACQASDATYKYVNACVFFSLWQPSHYTPHCPLSSCTHTSPKNSTYTRSQNDALNTPTLQAKTAFPAPGALCSPYAASPTTGSWRSRCLSMSSPPTVPR